MGASVNVLDKAKADELIKLGFHCVSQRVSDDKQICVFMNSPRLMKILTEKFSDNEFYIGKTVNF